MTLYQVSRTHACLSTHQLGSVTTRMALDIVENVPIQKMWHNDEWFIIQNISAKEFWRDSVKLFDWATSRVLRKICGCVNLDQI